MKLTGCFLLAAVSMTFAYNRNILDYSVRIINHLASVHIGPFECIFFDISAEGFFADILEDVARSPKLDHVVRVVVRGRFRREYMTLPHNAPVILINPGSDEAMFGNENRMDIAYVIGTFNPIAKVLVFVDFDTYNEYLAQTLVVWTKFNNAVFVDKRTGRLRGSSLKNYIALVGRPHPRDLFEWHKRELRGGTITFNVGPLESWGAPMEWFKATSCYLNAKLDRYRGPNRRYADISMQTFNALKAGARRSFDYFYILQISMGRILVPKGRPVNAVELVLMPFKWQAWMILLTVLVLAEVVNILIPNLFRNDPLLLVVCGFERHNLHQAGRWEKLTLHSLIILMFFMTNAFETKIISLMVDRPTVQPIKSLDDFDKHGMKIFANLEVHPEAVNHSLVGKYIVHGVREIWETIPGVAMYVTQDVADLAPKFSFNFERGEPWFDVLKDEFLDEIRYYETSYRSPLLAVFWFTYLAFVEAGLMELHKWRHHRMEYAVVWGRRPRKGKESEIYLKFGDLLLAWIVIGFGLGVSFVGFVGELACSRYGRWIGKIWEWIF